VANDVTPMVPVPDERDEEIFAAWEVGAGLRSLARQFGVSVLQIEQALDRMLPSFSAASQLRAYKRELEKMECLSAEFYALAKRDKSPEHAHLVARLNERICAMRGIGPVNIHWDPHTVQVEAQPSSFEKIKNAINHVYMQQPQAQRDAFDLVREIGGEKALELLRAGAKANGHGDGSGGDAPSDPDPGPSKRSSVGYDCAIYDVLERPC